MQHHAPVHTEQGCVAKWDYKIVLEAGDYCLQLPHGVPSVDERGVIASRARLHLLSIWDEK